MKVRIPTPSPGLRRGLLLLLMAFLLLWVLFLDSHSVYRRWKWHRELEHLRRENARLEAEIRHLEEELARPISDETVERIAREEYGMHRPEETVYRVEKR